MNKFIYFILLFFFFSYISGYSDLGMNYIPEKYDTSYISKTFRVYYSYSSYNYKQYDFITIKIENQESSYLGQIAFFSPSDETCEKERKLMSMSSEGDSVFIIKKSEFNQYSSFYICVKCLDEKKCSYKIKVGQNYISYFPFAETSYTYYVSRNYTKMNFGIRAEDNIRDLIENNKNNNVYELFWIKRLYNNKFFPYNNAQIKEDYNVIYLTQDISNEKRYADFDILSYEKDEIRVGSSLIINGINNKPLGVNDIETIGHLNSASLKKECFTFKINNYYSTGETFILQGYIYDKFAKTFFVDEYNSQYKSTIKEITDGIIFEILTKTQATNRKFCVTFLESDKYEQLSNITFSLQLISHTIKTFSYYFITPQIPEIVFPRFLKGGEYMILPNIKYPKTSTKMSITINQYYGYPKIFLYRYFSFPFYQLSEDDFKWFDDVELNKLHEYKFFIDNDSFNIYNYLLIINCPDINEYCIFDTTFFSENEYVVLSEGKFFSQILDEGEKNFYQIDFDKYIGISKIIIELLPFNSEVNIKFENNLNLINYFLLNKNIYIINGNELSEKKIKFVIDSNNKAYYSVRYTLLRGNENINKMELINKIGINYIDSINTSLKNKTIEVQSSKYGKKFPILINFYSPNCKFQITKDGEELETYLYKNFYQENLDDGIKYIYNLSFIETETLNYENKCLLFSNNINLTMDNNNYKFGALLMNENTPHIFKFQKNNFKTIKYIYPNIDIHSNYLVNLKVFNTAKYIINIGTDTKNIKKVNFNISTIIPIEHKLIKCKWDECYFIFEITLEEALTSDDPMLETTLYSIKDKYIYLEKGIIKEKFIKKNNNLYFFTDIGLEDEGYIMYDYLKEKNEITAKIVKKEEIHINKEVNWEGLTFGKDVSNYDVITKKLIFTKKDTSDCQNGCYILINIKSPNINYIPNKIDYYTFKILVSLTNKDILALPKIKFEPDEYIIGTLFNKNYNEKMFELYELNIPYNASSIDIECLSENVKLLIYVGNEIKDNYDFVVKNGETINILNKDIIEIFKNYKKSNIINSIENINIIIYVYTEKIDLIDVSYSFKVHLNKKDQLKINNVKTSQKTLCQPMPINENENENANENQKYRCLFMITPSKLNALNYLILYSKSQSKDAKTSIYGKYLTDNDIYHLDKEELSAFPDENNSQYNSEINNKNYILLPPDENQNYFYVSVISDSPSTIEFFSNFYNYNDDFIPNPNSMQIFVLNKSLKNEIKLNFISQNPIMINVQSLYGKGEINYNNKKYEIKEKNDKISFALGSKIEDYLIIKNKNEDSTQIEDFIFYIEYYFRNSTINFDKINFGENSEIFYENADYPLYFYSKFDQNLIDYDINILFYFSNLTLKDTSKLTQIIQNKELNIFSIISEEKNKYTFLNNTKNEELELKYKGIYDPALCVGQIYIPKDIINNHIMSEYDDLLYYLAIEKNGENDKIIYNGLSMETTYIRENSGIPIEENKYHFGKLYDNETVNSYKLKIDKSDLTNYIIMQFSSNSKNVNFTLTTEDNNQDINNTFDEYENEEKEGKIYTIFRKPNDTDYIFLNVFIDNNDTLNISENNTDILNNYVFKYNNIMDKNNIYKYSITNNDAKLKGKVYQINGLKKYIEIDFNRISNEENYKVIYSLKYILNEDLIKDELFNSIALTESNSTIIQFTNNYKNKIIIPLDIYHQNFSYIQLIAQIIDGENVEYISYEPINSSTELEFEEVEVEESNETEEETEAETEEEKEIEEETEEENEAETEEETEEETEDVTEEEIEAEIEEEIKAETEEETEDETEEETEEETEDETKRNNQLDNGDDNNSKKESGKNYHIEIIVLGGIFLLILITAIILLAKCYKKKNNVAQEKKILNEVEMINPIEYDDVLLDRP